MLIGRLPGDWLVFERKSDAVSTCAGPDASGSSLGSILRFRLLQSMFARLVLCVDVEDVGDFMD